jgi:hypothetical protein
VACRAIVGFGVGGAVVPFDLLAEFLPNKHRGTFLIYIEGFWTIGMSKLKCDGACGYLLLIYGVCVYVRLHICCRGRMVGIIFGRMEAINHNHRHPGNVHCKLDQIFVFVLLLVFGIALVGNFVVTGGNRVAARISTLANYAGQVFKFQHFLQLFSVGFFNINDRDHEAAAIVHHAAEVNGVKLAPFQLDNTSVLEEAKSAEEISVLDFLKKDRLPLMIPLW